MCCLLLLHSIAAPFNKQTVPVVDLASVTSPPQEESEYVINMPAFVSSSGLVEAGIFVCET